MTLQQARYVVELAKCKSFNQAARNLFISQPTLSNAVKDLEGELGIRIFERSSKGILLTADGVEFLLLCEELLEQADRIDQRYSTRPTGNAARFQVSSQHYAFVADAFVRTMDAHAGKPYQFSLKETKTMAAIEDVHLRKSDLAVIYLTRSNETILHQIFQRWSLDFHQLTLVKPHVFIRRDHPLAVHSSLTPEQLAPYPVLAYEQDGSGSSVMSEEVVVVERPRQIVFAQDRGTTNNIIASTDCYNVGTGYIIPGIITDNIISRPLEGNWDPMRIGWICPVNRALGPEVQTFVDYLSQSLERYHPDKNRPPA